MLFYPFEYHNTCPNILSIPRRINSKTILLKDIEIKKKLIEPEIQEMCSRIGNDIIFTNKTDKHLNVCDEREEIICGIILDTKTNNTDD